jgi:hypothetical protein
MVAQTPFALAVSDTPALGAGARRAREVAARQARLWQRRRLVALAGETFNQLAGVQILNVPYKSIARESPTSSAVTRR